MIGADGNVLEILSDIRTTRYTVSFTCSFPASVEMSAASLAVSAPVTAPSGDTVDVSVEAAQPSTWHGSFTLKFHTDETFSRELNHFNCPVNFPLSDSTGANCCIAHDENTGMCPNDPSTFLCWNPPCYDFDSNSDDPVYIG